MLLLEEPINFLGHLTSTGHSAVLLDDLCSDDHLHLRPCRPDELGVVISRYKGLDGFDWLAMAPSPYLYAVDDPDQAPSRISRTELDTLREHYRASHLATVAPDPHNPYWIQLVGAAYRRRIVCIHVRTTPEQDRHLMLWLNTRRNASHFNLFLANCADFSREVLDVLFPGAVHRNLFFDAGMTTPKQLASSPHHYSKRHPGLGFQVSVIDQVPGNVPRSGQLYGVTQSFVRTKPYLLPLAVLQPVGLGSVIVSGLCDRRYSTRSLERLAPRVQAGDLDLLGSWPHSAPLPLRVSAQPAEAG